MIRLRVEGLMLERLLERAMERGATFRRVERDGERALTLDTGERGARIVRELCARHSLRLEETRVSGLSALKRFCLRRWTLLPGVLLCAALLCLYLQRVWMVDVAFVGERPAGFSEADVRAMLAEMGARPGMLARDVDTDEIELALSARSEDFSFVGARVQGVRLLVEVAPSLEEPEVYVLDEARDLVAACDGVIVSVNAQSGEAAVEAGDTVRKGDVLIRGEERASAEETRGIAARGEVVARTWAEVEADVSLVRLERVYTGQTRTNSLLRLLSWQLPLSPAEPFASCETTVERLPVGGLFLPLMIERTTYAECEVRGVDQDVEALKTALSEHLFTLLEANIAAQGANSLQIVDKWIDYSMIEEGSLRARAVLEVHRDIATTRDALAREG